MFVEPEEDKREIRLACACGLLKMLRNQKLGGLLSPARWHRLARTVQAC